MKQKVFGILAVLLIYSQLSVIGQITQPVEPLSALQVTDRLLVSVVLGDRNEMIIEGEEAEHVQAVFKDGDLRLKMAPGHNLQGQETTVTLYTSSLSKITVRKGAVVNVEQHALKTDALSLTAREGGKIRALIEAVGVDASANTGSIIDVLGTAKKVNVSSGTGAAFYGKDLQSEIAYARASGGGRVEISATTSADVVARLGGVIDVYGDPDQKHDKTILGGEIRFQ